MKKSIGCILFSYLFSIAATLPANCDTIILKGVYNGKNISIQNPFRPGTSRFCIQSFPAINDTVTTRIVKSSVIEIDLASHKLKKGDKVEIVIMHGCDCKPNILNAQVLEQGYKPKK
jgi:hypothetical protein